jgi:adenylate cyclase
VLKDTSKLKLGGERRELTVLFSDIRGFTTISERLAPEALTELLNEYLTPMTDLVFKFDGTLDKYMGDAIMAIYGAPVPYPHHPRAACETALDMMEELARLRQGWKARGLPEIDIGIGVNTGPMSVGNMGSRTRFDYTVLGDNVNLGSRLEGLNKTYGTHIIISQFTQALVKDDFTFREIDSVIVKGKLEPVKIFELLHRGLADPAKDSWLAAYNGALAAYKGRRFEEGIALFGALSEQRPGDGLVKMYLERCRQMKDHPPPADWDGVFKMTTK